MATTASFASMLKRYMPDNMLVEEIKERNYFIKKIKMDNMWFGGRYEIPFKGAAASSVRNGLLTAANDIAELVPVLGYEDQYREVWGSMLFNEKDLDLHQRNEASFIKNQLYPMIDDFLANMESKISHQISAGARIDSLLADGTALGIAKVSFPERFEIGQKCQIRNNDPAAADVYVTAINMESGELTVSASRGGVALDISAFTLAKASGIYFDGTVNTTTGALQNTFNSLRDSLLSAANGGSASLHNQLKVNYPFLQAKNIDGSGLTAATMLEGIFDAFMEVSRVGKGRPTDVLMSFKNYAAVVKQLETLREFSKTDSDAGFGFVSVDVRGPQGGLKLVAIREMDDDILYIIDWRALVLAGSHFFDKKRYANGELFEQRAETGISYIMDIRFFGNLIVKNPSHCGIIHSVSI